jgi:hypothetical protein
MPLEAVIAGAWAGLCRLRSGLLRAAPAGTVGYARVMYSSEEAAQARALLESTSSWAVTGDEDAPAEPPASLADLAALADEIADALEGAAGQAPSPADASVARRVAAAAREIGNGLPGLTAGEP